MAQPTDEGYYWLCDGQWFIVRVIRMRGALVIEYIGGSGTDPVDLYTPQQWGAKITQGPHDNAPPAAER